MSNRLARAHRRMTARPYRTSTAHLSSGCFRQRSEAGDASHIGRVIAFSQGYSQRRELVAIDVTHIEGNLFGAGYAEPLSLFQGRDKFSGLQEAVGRAGVQPGKSPAHFFDGQFIAIEIDLVQVGDLQFTTPRRPDA